MPQAPGEEIVTRSQLAFELGLSVRQIARLEKKGEGPQRINLGRAVTYRRSAIEAWLRSREQVRESAPAPVAKPPSATGRNRRKFK
jgi:predicted DNA-binding transcriptional regulator AlpA